MYLTEAKLKIADNVNFVFNGTNDLKEILHIIYIDLTKNAFDKLKE